MQRHLESAETWELGTCAVSVRSGVKNKSDLNICPPDLAEMHFSIFKLTSLLTVGKTFVLS